MSTANIPAHSHGPFFSATGVSGRWMNWLFADKGRMFWVLQIAGWLGFFVLHILSVSTFLAGRTAPALLYSVASSGIGFLTTSILARPMYQLARRQGPVLLLSIVLTSTIIMAVAMSAIKALTASIVIGRGWIELDAESASMADYILLLVPSMPANLFLLGSWAGFYFGINYYLNLRNEMERALLSGRLADQAQLKMLRYQLNPHFLFNTLNAISTLVLEQNTKHANTMLTQLSAFLRYSLDSDPLLKTSLAEEVRALKLYLEIEKTRFGDRLKVNFDIDEETLDARIPSLILQPAIENAIKYAIAQMEGGGEITIIAQREGKMLRLRVCDNGPNAPADPSKILANAKNGVGLVNMRERLIYMYQDRGEFRLSKLQPQGLCVSITVPFENRGQQK